MTNFEREQMLAQFQKQFPSSLEPLFVWAPGRVNLLGEHTDYNQGFVFPMAIDVGISMVGALNGSDQVNLYSLDFKASASFSLDQISRCNSQTWTNYIRGVFQQFQVRGYKPKGVDLILQGNVPQGAGLSSSAALEVATAVLLIQLHNWNVDPVELVKLAQDAENKFVGVASGIMDQFASMMGEKDHALCLDCRSLDYKLIALPFTEQGYALAVVNSAVKRGLVDSEYNTRREQCEVAVEKLKQHLPGIQSLRDVGVEHLSLVNELPEEMAKRARHVITENERVLQGIKALEAGDLTEFGKLLNASHSSLKDDFEVSCRELDLLVSLALEVPGVLGSRMTGAGFGGCTIALVPQANLPQFRQHINELYSEATGLQPEIFVFQPAPGAWAMAEGETPQT